MAQLAEAFLKPDTIRELSDRQGFDTGSYCHMLDIQPPIGRTPTTSAKIQTEIGWHEKKLSSRLDSNPPFHIAMVLGR